MPLFFEIIRFCIFFSFGNISILNFCYSSSEFATLAEDVLENTIRNIICAANIGEVNLTTKPRTIALPSSRAKKGL